MGIENFSNESMGSIWTKYRNLIIAAILLLVLIFGAILAFTDWLGNWIDLRKIAGWETNVNKLTNEANQINANLQNLQIQNGIQGAEVNALNGNFEGAKNATNGARNETNKALQNQNRIEGKDFNGTSLTEAQKARCRAFPDRPECPK